MKLWKILGVELYEVGDIFINMSGNNPGNRFKGTWSLIAQGRTLVGVDTSQSEFNSARKTGGSKTHTLTVDEMPNHRHGLSYNTNNSAGVASYPHLTGGYGAQGTDNGHGFHTIQTTGGGKPHNNLQPYLTTYIWERVS